MKNLGYSKITGIGAYLPKQTVTSSELMHEVKSKKFGVSETFLERASGIIERRISDNSESFDYLAIQAAQGAMVDAGIHPLDIDMILFCGIDRDRPEPSTAHEIQKQIGAINAECLDISNACIGMLNGLSVANAYIGIGAAENILVCTGEKPTRLLYDVIRQLHESNNNKNFFRRMLGAFTVGDAGGAFIISRSKDDTGCQYMKFGSTGEYNELCYYEHTSGGVEFEMKMEEISHAMVSLHEQSIKETYGKLGWLPQDVDHLYCHQVGAKPHKKMAGLAQVSIEKAPITYNHFGNLTSATFAVNMSLNRPTPGSKALFLGAGSGLTICQLGMQF